MKKLFHAQIKKYLTIYKSLVLVLPFTCILGSCLDMTEDPKGLLTEESFFKTEEDLDAAVTAVYYPLGSNPWDGFCSTRIWTPLLGADDLTCHPASSKNDFREFDRFVSNNLNFSLFAVSWRNPFKIVNAANNVLENYEKVTGRDIAKKQAAAQACYLRAFAYFWMTRVFGDIPLITSTVPELDCSPSTVANVYEIIISDLLFAKDNLPVSWPGEPGKPTSWAAKSLLSSVYLTMAGWPLKDESKYALAAAEAKDVIENGPYRLLDNFADLWKMSSDNNDEFIWSVQCTNGDSQFSTIVGYTTMPPEENGWSDVFFEVGFYNRFPSGPRKEATFHTIFQESPENTAIHFENSLLRHPFIAKYRDGALGWMPSFEHHYMTSRDVCYLRFAEILLTYAEAQAMAEGAPNSFAYECVNRVRERAGLDDLASGLSKVVFRDSIIAERGWELAAEYSRWFDLIRTEKVEEMSELKDEEDMPPLGMADKSKYHAPVPFNEVNLNPNLANRTQYP